MKKFTVISTGFLKRVLQGLVLLSCLNLWPQEPMVVPRLSGELVFDGVPDEEAWQAIEALPLVMHMPVYGNEPSEISVIKFAYDKDYLYVSGIFHYKDPNDMERENPRLPFSAGRTVLLKYTYTFVL